jgi:predicted esterase
MPPTNHFLKPDGTYDEDAIVEFFDRYNSRSRDELSLVAQKLFSQARFLGISSPPITHQNTDVVETEKKS